jgi:DsbC/DsbD-like thiol-disulfide interchange protein
MKISLPLFSGKRFGRCVLVLLCAGAFAASTTVTTASGAGGASTTIHVEDVRAKIAISDAQSYGGHQLGVTVDFAVAPGWHIYGEPLPSEYTTTKVKFAGDLVQRQALKFPPPTPLRFAALDQTFPVYHGDFKVAGNIVLKPKLKPGDYKLTGTIEFQECNDSMCKLPQSAHFKLPLTIKAPAAPKA